MNDTRSILIRTVGRRRTPGFTLIELLVVIGIILLVIAAILPAFGRIIESQNYSSAINSVTATLGNARARAISTGRRTGVVFLWDARRERYTLQLVELFVRQGATLTNLPVNGVLGAFCESFRPAPGTVPVELPRGVAVFGLSSYVVKGALARQQMTNTPPTWWWYSGEVINDNDSDPANDITLWLFPRNDPRIYMNGESGVSERQTLGVDPWRVLRGETVSGVTFDQALRAVRNASTFFVQFDESGTVVAPRRSGGSDYYDSYVELTDEPVNLTTPNAQPYDDQNRFDPENFGLPLVAADERRPNPEFMMRLADQLAVVDLGRLTEGTGIPRPWLVRSGASSADLAPSWLIEGGYRSDDRARAVSRWIDLNAEIINFNRFSGNVLRRSSS